MPVSLVVMIFAFALLFILLLFRVNLALSMLVSSLVLFVFTLPLDAFLIVLFDVLFDLKTVELTVTVSLITIFGFYYQESGFLDGLVKGLEDLTRDAKYVMMLVPAIFGLLPTLGGALMSAPVVEIEGRRLGVDGGLKNFINLWFRHIGFLVYPIGAMIVLASLLTGVHVFEIIFYLVPAFLVALVLGYFLGVKSVGVNVLWSGGSRDFGSFVGYLSPLLASIVVAVVVRSPFGTAMAILLGIMIILFSSGFRLFMLLSAVWRSRFYTIALASIMIMFFKTVLDVCGVSGEIAFLSYGVPRIIVHTLVPFISGFLMGSPTGALAFSLSIILVLNSSLPPQVVSLIYAFTLFGYVVSPLHLCFILSSEYFKVRMVDTYPRLLAATLITLLSVIVSVFVLGGFGFYL